MDEYEQVPLVESGSGSTSGYREGFEENDLERR
jgi:hypothetical protein